MGGQVSLIPYVNIHHLCMIEYTLEHLAKQAFDVPRRQCETCGQAYLKAGQAFDVPPPHPYPSNTLSFKGRHVLF